MVVVAVAVAARAVAVAVVVGGQEVVEKIVVAESGDRRGSERSMTEVVVAPVSWAEQWLGVVGGQDVLDLMRSWADKKKVHISR